MPNKLKKVFYATKESWNKELTNWKATLQAESSTDVDVKNLYELVSETQAWADNNLYEIKTKPSDH